MKAARTNTMIHAAKMIDMQELVLVVEQMIDVVTIIVMIIKDVRLTKFYPEMKMVMLIDDHRRMNFITDNRPKIFVLIEHHMMTVGKVAVIIMNGEIMILNAHRYRHLEMIEIIIMEVVVVINLIIIVVADKISTIDHIIMIVKIILDSDMIIIMVVILIGVAVVEVILVVAITMVMTIMDVMAIMMQQINEIHLRVVSVINQLMRHEMKQLIRMYRLLNEHGATTIVEVIVIEIMDDNLTKIVAIITVRVDDFMIMVDGLIMIVVAVVGLSMTEMGAIVIVIGIVMMALEIVYTRVSVTTVEDVVKNRSQGSHLEKVEIVMSIQNQLRKHLRRGAQEVTEAITKQGQEIEKGEKSFFRCCCCCIFQNNFYVCMYA